MSELNTTNTYEGALDWNSEIEETYLDLPDGTYDFTVVDLERGHYEPKPTSKIKEQCPQVKINVEIKDPNSDQVVKVNSLLILHTRTKGLLCNFFRSIGVMKKGESLKMDWNVIGKTGKLKLSHNDKNYMQIEKFLSPEETTTQTKTSWF
ncbi:hypothetical protein [Solobacterium moorei]|uniref:hypothetical protein n=1 Tax=Solobacterium moorei TaxID=102148 RepID=UPI000414E118|nr:hypothetical protein [Solobacterium moorei]BET21219.1 hypothetical protein RGT18_08070 [Solobacterium moorei]